MDDSVAERYDPLGWADPAGTRRTIDWTVKQITPFLGDRILQVHAGIGLTARRLPRKPGLTLSECQPEQLELLRQAASYNPLWDVIELDLEKDEHSRELSGEFDTVLCLERLATCKSDADCVLRMANMLTPGGRLVLQVPQHLGLMSKLDTNLGRQRRYALADIEQLFALAGLDMEVHRSYHLPAALAWLTAGRLAGKNKLGRLPLKLLDVGVPLWRRLEMGGLLPGAYLIAVGRKPAA
jgi:hypothetical protein